MGSGCSIAFCVAVVANPVSDGWKTDFAGVTVHNVHLVSERSKNQEGCQPASSFAAQRCFERQGSHELNTGRESEREPREDKRLDVNTVEIGTYRDENIDVGRVEIQEGE